MAYVLVCAYLMQGARVSLQLWRLGARVSLQLWRLANAKKPFRGYEEVQRGGRDGENREGVAVHGVMWVPVP